MIAVNNNNKTVIVFMKDRFFSFWNNNDFLKYEIILLYFVIA